MLGASREEFEASERRAGELEAELSSVRRERDELRDRVETAEAGGADEAARADELAERVDQ